MAYTFNPFTGTFDNAPSTLKGDSAYSTLCAISGDLVTYDYLHDGFLPLSGGTITGNLSVGGTFGVGINTSTTLYAENSSVGINTETPNEELTVVGDVSASGVIYAFGGNSSMWNEVFTSYSSNSSTFLTSETDSQTLSFNEAVKTLSISNGNTVSLSALVDVAGIDTEVRALTSNWQTTYTTVLANSSTWVNEISAQNILARVYNADAVAMSKGDVVYTFGATGDVMSVKLASNISDDTSATTLGFVNETIEVGGIGYVVIGGQVIKMNLPHQTYTEGDILWLGSTPGSFTNVKPVAPNHGVYLGVVERANNGDGLVYVKVQNGYELNEIHDVLITSVSAGQILRRNNTNNLWINTDDGAKWDSVYSTVSSISSTWLTSSYLSTNDITISALTVTSTISAKDEIYFNDHKAIKTTTTDAPGISAVTKIVSVSALPLIQEVNTLYILV